MRLLPPPPPGRSRFLSEADCLDIAHRLARYAIGGGDTVVAFMSRWVGNVRWARNRVTSSGEDRNHFVRLTRQIRGAREWRGVEFNEVSDPALIAAVRRAERLVQLEEERIDGDLVSTPDSHARPLAEPAPAPHLFYESTYQLDAGQRADVARQLMQSASAAGMLSAGYIEVSATSLAFITSWGVAKYYPFTWAHMSMTVRDPTGVGSGWAGVDWPDWSHIDGAKLTAVALDKCLQSRHAVAVEPGRYTTILETQAVGDFIGRLTADLWGWGDGSIGRTERYGPEDAPFGKIAGGGPVYGRPDHPIGYSKLGEKVIDERLTVGADPMDPELGFPPIQNFLHPQLGYGGEGGDVYHAATWIEHGVLTNLAYKRDYASHLLGKSTGLPNQGAMRISVSGPTTTTAEMIATTQRGLLVTHFDNIQELDEPTLLFRGFTRDGLWLIENGKISKPVKNMMFVESILFALNNVEQLGVPQRGFHPLPAGSSFYLFGNPQPFIVPPMKIKDFSFTALSDAI